MNAGRRRATASTALTQAPRGCANGLPFTARTLRLPWAGIQKPLGQHGEAQQLHRAGLCLTGRDSD